MNGPKHRDLHREWSAELKWIITEPTRQTLWQSNSGTMTPNKRGLAQVTCRAEQAAIFGNQPSRFTAWRLFV